MGGAIFAKGPNPLYVPRMPPKVYNHILKYCQVQLRQLFIAVTTPIEGPAKTSFGDVDIALAWPRTEFCSSQDAWKVRRVFPENEILEAAARLIGGVRVDKVRDSKGRLSEVHVALPWPDKFRSLVPPPGTDKLDATQETTTGQPEDSNSGDHHAIMTTTPEAFVQIDLHVWPDLPTLQWLLFKHAHGDLWNILGPTIRALGLTADETGLHLRIPEIERHDIKRARVLLSSDPAQILAFLGMASGNADGEPWAGQFVTKKEFFEYATSNRFFCGGVMFPPTKYADREDNGPRHDDASTGRAGKNDNESRYAENEKKPLRSNERRRIKYRPLFAEFLSDFLPEKRREAAAALRQSHFPSTYSQIHPEANAETPISCADGEEEKSIDHEQNLQAALESQFPHTRASVREECFTYFGPTVRWDYDRTLKAWTIEKQRMAIKRDIIKTIVPPPETVVDGKAKSSKAAISTPEPQASAQSQQDKGPDQDQDQDQRQEKAKDKDDADPWNGERLPPSFRGQITSALAKIVLDNDFSTLTDSNSGRAVIDDIKRQLAPQPAAPLRDESTDLYNEDHIRVYVTESWRKVAEILQGKNAVTLQRGKSGGWKEGKK